MCESRIERQAGFTLIEVLVTMVLLAIIASVAMPYAEMTVRRQKELELRRGLREIRTALDRFHADWREDLIAPLAGAASRDGYPVRLSVLIEGVRLTDGRTRKYLRRIPRDPFADQSATTGDHWRLIGYRDSVEGTEWGREDVYDVRSRSERQAIDGSRYEDW
jgi:general secretion pathway protein G